ncbi:MAG: sigma-54 dependent transcriptional regulator [Candidatus Zixiibacteriota bacterium]
MPEIHPQFLTITADGELSRSWREALQPLGGTHTAVDGFLTALRRLADGAPDVLLIDPTGGGLSTDQLAVKLRLRAPIADILVAGEELGSPEDAVHDRWGLAAAVMRSCEPARLRSRIGAILADREHVARCGWVGLSQSLRAASDLLLAASRSDTTVLIEGESGTGKELAARALHNNSPRAGKAFLALNCTAFPETLLESELFGHEKGAFTDAFGRKKGIFEAVEGGTIFLDEIGETKPSLQARLLRVLEERQVRPIGATKAIPVDFRIVAATNRDLGRTVIEGAFRQDLYYRLAVVQLTLRPLRERPSDVPALLAHHLAAGRPPSRLIDRLDESALVRLLDYDWPGNVRELRNFIERAQVRFIPSGTREGHPNDVLNADHVGTLLETVRTPLNLPVVTGRRAENVEREMIFAALSELKRDLEYLKRRVDRLRLLSSGDSEDADFASMKQVERDRIALALKESHGNRSRAARLLGIGTRTLYRKIREYGL